MSICLAMIVKDEEHILAQTLANLIQYIPITDYCISDTGSSDKTVEIIKTFFA
jgi:glycosyltransferase involved in cell wall biosynthesis